VITSVQVVSVPVSDQERAREFYVETLGMEVVNDAAFDNQRWIEVRPQGSATSLTLVTWFESMPAGSLSGLVFAADDVQTTCDALKAKGVTFEMELTELPWGRQAVFLDPDGNRLVLSGR
jgi:catechol 2,3-dioxygenase-like lactoylglutathione lyase family enzyme